MMTREEAIAILEESKRQNEIMRDNPSTFWASQQMAEGVKNAKRRIAALDFALSALRPVSLECVEKVWRGEWKLIGAGKNGRGGIWNCTRCEKSYPYKCDFCPRCGAPMTDEAEQMVMERLEALQNEAEAD